MSSPLLTKIAGILSTALPSAGVTVGATLIRSTQGARTPGAFADGPAITETSIACKGFVSTETHTKIGDTLVAQADRVVNLLGGTLGGVVPTSGDKITIDGKTQRVIAVEGSVAVWTCLCRS